MIFKINKSNKNLYNHFSLIILITYYIINNIIYCVCVCVCVSNIRQRMKSKIINFFNGKQKLKITYLVNNLRKILSKFRKNFDIRFIKRLEKLFPHLSMFY